MNLVKTIKFFLPAILLCFAFFGCSGSEQPTPDDLIVGNWEYMNQTWCEFKADSTCIIGGMAGEYKIGDDNSIALTVYGSDETLEFEWAENADSVDFEHWYVDKSSLYLNGMQYPRIDEENTDSENNQTKTTGESVPGDNVSDADSFGNASSNSSSASSDS